MLSKSFSVLPALVTTQPHSSGLLTCAYLSAVISFTSVGSLRFHNSFFAYSRGDVGETERCLVYTSLVGDNVTIKCARFRYAQVRKRTRARQHIKN